MGGAESADVDSGSWEDEFGSCLVPSGSGIEWPRVGKITFQTANGVTEFTKTEGDLAWSGVNGIPNGSPIQYDRDIGMYFSKNAPMHDLGHLGSTFALYVASDRNTG